MCESPVYEFLGAMHRTGRRVGELERDVYDLSTLLHMLIISDTFKT